MKTQFFRDFVYCSCLFVYFCQRECLFENNMDAIKRISKFEKQFSRHQYSGGGHHDFIFKEGGIPVMISAPHSVNQLREGQLKWADKMTGGIAMYMHELTGCHMVCSTKYVQTDPNYDSNENDDNTYQTELRKYVEQNDIKVLIDLHGAASGRPYAVEIGTAPERDGNGNIIGDEHRSLHGYGFIATLIKYTFDYVLRDIDSPKKEVWQNKIFDAGSQNTVTKHISEHTDCACVQLEINAIYRDVNGPANFMKLLEGLSYIIATLGRVDWSAKKINVFRLWQSSSHKPQDKVGLSPSLLKRFDYKENDLLYICSIKGSEIVRLHQAAEHELSYLHEGIAGDDWAVSEESGASEEKDQEYLFLTNRLIESLFGREWIQGRESKAYLRGAPVILYESYKDVYRIGLPKANQIDGVFFSSELFQSKLKDADKYDFVLFNRYTDSRFYVPFDKADYQDYGRVKNEKGEPAMKVMIPRYYRRLLGYVNTPFSEMRDEEYRNLQSRLKEDALTFLQSVYKKELDHYRLYTDVLNRQKFWGLIGKIAEGLKPLFKSELNEDEFYSLKKRLCDEVTTPLNTCYKKLTGEVFYQIKDEIQSDQKFQKDLLQVTEIQRFYAMYDQIEILRVPRDAHLNRTLWGKLCNAWNRFVISALEVIIGDVEYSLKTGWTSETDDKNNVARLNANMMSLIGVAENDKIVVKFGPKKAILRVLANNELSDFEIGIPAPTRKNLGMNSVNDIVIVSRDMKHAFKRHSQEQVIAIIGMILAVFQVTRDMSIGAALCIVFTPVVLYFVLNEERIKVK